jgi:hypothetical protein
MHTESIMQVFLLKKQLYNFRYVNQYARMYYCGNADRSAFAEC